MKITRNISGNANVKNADAGFRQKALFVNRNCRTTAPEVLTRSPPRRP